MENKITMRARSRQNPARFCGLFGALLLASTAPGYAGGLWLHEFGTPSQGRINAGAHAGVDDASTALFNPAAMSRLESSELMVNGSVFLTETEFDIERASPLNGTDAGGDAGGSAPGAGLFYVRPLNENWHLGVSLAGLTGASLDYDNDWVGRYQVQEVSLLGLALMPSVSYKVNDKLSLGLGVAIMYTELDMDIAVPNLNGPPGSGDGKASVDGDDVVVAAQLSIAYQLTEQSRLGLMYNSEFDVSYNGNAEVEPAGTAVGVDTDLILAQRIYAGFSHDLRNDWTLHLSLGWEDWSSMDNIFLSGENNGVVLARNWDDTWHVAAGVEYKLSQQWSLTTGVGYDSNPVDAEDRTADMPVDRQIRIGAGAVYTRPSGLEIASSIVYADLGDAEIDALGYGGDYSTNTLLALSVSANWKF
jgi:long-chain fatty acid transport protein